MSSFAAGIRAFVSRWQEPLFWLPSIFAVVLVAFYLFPALDPRSGVDGLGTITYQWQRGGVDISGATGGTYTPVQADVGSVLRVVASYTDLQGTAESVASIDTAAVSNVNDTLTGSVTVDDTTMRTRPVPTAAVPTPRAPPCCGC